MTAHKVSQTTELMDTNGANDTHRHKQTTTHTFQTQPPAEKQFLNADLNPWQTTNKTAKTIKSTTSF